VEAYRTARREEKKTHRTREREYENWKMEELEELRSRPESFIRKLIKSVRNKNLG
jgi:hypothetical protein